jgi:hypothetical protein
MCIFEGSDEVIVEGMFKKSERDSGWCRAITKEGVMFCNMKE